MMMQQLVGNRSRKGLQYIILRRRWKSTTSTANNNVQKSSTITVQQQQQQQQGDGEYWNRIKLMSVGSLCGFVGFGLGSTFVDSTLQQEQQEQKKQKYPSGVPLSCCSCEKEEEQKHVELISKLKEICGNENVMTSEMEKKIYCTGARIKHENGTALAVITPTTLRDVVKALQVIVDAQCVVLPQGANTGLTGGSTPRGGDDGSRPYVVVNMKKHLNTFFPIDDGRRVVCLAGAGIADLATFMASWKQLESHSILGSTFLNPTVAAGVAYGSGGTQLRKGPAYTDRALYIQITQDKWGKNLVQVVNTLGVEGLQDEDCPNASALEQLDIYARDVQTNYRRAMAKSSQKGLELKSSMAEPYKAKLTNFQPPYSNQVNRYNADTTSVSHVNRSEGKVFVLATVHDTFESPSQKVTYWISFDTLEKAYEFRQHVALDNPRDLPMSMEYMNDDTVDVINSSGRVLGNVITTVGMMSPIVGWLWNIKLKIESLPFTWAPTICDLFLYKVNDIMPRLLPPAINQMTTQYQHHVALTMGDWNQNELLHFQQRLQKFVKQNPNSVKVYTCQSKKEEEQLNAFRFVAAPSFRTWCIGTNTEGFSVDYALPHDCTSIPTLSSNQKRMRYTHFGCNVVHEDIAGPETLKYKLKQIVEEEHNGKLPAEHGHGTEYMAPSSTQNRWKSMDPLNVMNPGIGGTSSKYKYAE